LKTVKVNQDMVEVVVERVIVVEFGMDSGSGDDEAVSNR
jgi:hypothetical protein